MKKLILFFVVFTLYSCVATKYDAGYDQNNFTKISTGEKYIVYDKMDKKTVMTVTSIEPDTLRGTYKNQPFAIAKNDIGRIKKTQPWATAGLIAGSAAAVVVVAVAVTTVAVLSDWQ